MNTELLKQQYNSYRYLMEKLKQIDWNNPSKADVEYNSRIEKKVSEWKKNLATEEVEFLKNFERSKYHTHEKQQRQKSREMKKNYRTVLNHGAGWYGVNLGEPTSDGFSLSTQITWIRGKAKLIEVLKQFNYWTKLNGEILGF
ncbi:hypothetical protein [Limosilactobacillus reuteri]|uniref:hypothetical protein n=1 Tax=Limosilactobacillus reuteri TaxID=1598 RepID=UPI001E336DFB|nr:hypothetical protein [Limosilactobacillus reuteri]MCC4359186.1 hypothetical protein [Limosilactobacillus reuteri]MCC4361675.1 hypothetical protein [Limosilactobacillus reuteri]MCC4365488.1 hypothetical protein [Limosilactobacillus reuteri]